MDKHVRRRTPDSGHHVELTGTVTAREAATALGLNERTIRRTIARGDLLATKETGVFRIKHADLTKYRDHHRIPTAIPVRTVAGPPRLVPMPRRIKDPASDLPSPLTELIGRERALSVAATSFDATVSASSHCPVPAV